MDKALNEQRIILTHDLDFGKLLAFLGTFCTNVIFSGRYFTTSFAKVARCLGASTSAISKVLKRANPD